MLSLLYGGGVKVWSDLKNNTKKKAAKLYRAAQGTGGGPASKGKLSDLEERIMYIIGPQAATGIPIIPEIGLEVSIFILQYLFISYYS